MSPSEQRAIEAKRRKMKAFVKIASLSNMGNDVKDMDIENPDPAKLRGLMNNILHQKPVKVAMDENRCRFYRGGEKCDCPTFTASGTSDEDLEICICGHHKMYHKADLNENLSTQERPMWYASEDSYEFWERDEAREVLQEAAMESMVSQTRWRTITDPLGKKCFYNLKTGDITYDPPKSVPWRYAAETFAKSFPPLENEEEDPKKKKTDGQSMTKQKTRTRKQKTKQMSMQSSMGGSGLPGAVDDDDDDDDDEDDGLPPTKTLRVSRDPQGTARYAARLGNDAATQRYLGRTERKEKMKKVGFAAVLDFRSLSGTVK